MAADLGLFEQKIGITFNDKTLLTQAFIHRSYLNEHREIKLDHNERLEFLGDAVLELIITDHLYKSYPEETEGALTSYRAALVNAVTLGELAAEIGVNDFLLLSKGEAKDTGRARQIILANAYEAIVGAIYLDQGYDGAKKFISANLFPLTAKVVSAKLWQDAKSYFQEKAQETYNQTPRYELLSEAGPDHNKKFTVGLYIGDELVTEGEGHAKQEAEQDAAKKGLDVKGWR